MTDHTILYQIILPLAGFLFLMLQMIFHEILELRSKVKKFINETMSHDTHWFPDEPCDDYTNGF